MATEMHNTRRRSGRKRTAEDSAEEEEAPAPRQNTRATAAAAASASTAASSIAAEPASAGEATGVDADGATLVLGMAYVNSSYGTRARPETTIAVLRDRARLQALEEHGHPDPISLNHTHTAEQCAPKRHLCANFGSRAVKELLASFGPDCGRDDFFLRHVYCDYFRFPGEYMRGAYGSFLSSMLPALISQGLITHESDIVVPNLSGLHEGLDGKQFQRPCAKGSSALIPCYLDFCPLLAEQYPLYAATSCVDSYDLGGYSNAVELKQLHASHPFVRIRLTDCPFGSKQSFAFTFRSKLVEGAHYEEIVERVRQPDTWRLHVEVKLRADVAQKRKTVAAGTASKTAAPDASISDSDAAPGQPSLQLDARSAEQLSPELVLVDVQQQQLPVAANGHAPAARYPDSPVPALQQSPLAAVQAPETAHGVALRPRRASASLAPITAPPVDATLPASKRTRRR